MPLKQPVSGWSTNLVLEARHLSKAYGGRKVLDDVSLHVAHGEGVALLGPNGAGKTTLLHLVAGVLRADAGTALVQGRSTAQAGGRRALAFVPQDAAVYDGLSARENITLFGRLQGLRGAALARATCDALDAAGLGQVAAQRAGTYSGGMRRRLSLACALVHAPALLLLDEPFEGVDEASRRHLTEVLAASKARGVALVLGTHRLDEVGTLCERACVLRDGKVLTEHALAAGSVSSRSAAPPCAVAGDER